MQSRRCLHFGFPVMPAGAAEECPRELFGKRAASAARSICVPSRQPTSPALLERFNRATDGTLVAEAEYLEAVAVRK
jgi:hypothetical protein